MATFDLARFRNLAFGPRGLPDHPMQTVAETRKLLGLLPEDDADRSIAELTSWASTMNLTESFTPGRRARVLMMLDDAARPFWRVLGQRYLAPKGTPREGRDGDPDILRAMFDSASEFASGFEIALDTSGHSSRWVEQNRARLLVRALRWSSRRLALAYMLHEPVTDAIWESLHRLYRTSADQELARSTLPAYEDGRHVTSAKREYVRPLLLELANPTGMRARDVELVYRIAARVATTVQLEAEASDAAAFAIVPSGHARPVLARSLKAGRVPPLYISAGNALPRLRAALERDLQHDPGDEDSLYGRGYTIRERNRVVRRLVEHWGFDPPRRRTARIGMATSVRLVTGFDYVLNVLPPVNKNQIAGSARGRLRARLDQTSKSLRRATLHAARDWRGRLIDASTGGMGIAIPAASAAWLQHDALVGILIEPGDEWVVGALRRIYSVDGEIRLGVQVIATHPRALWLEADVVRRESVWDEALGRDAEFGEHYRRAILLEPLQSPLSSGELLLPRGSASSGTLFGVPLPAGSRRIRVTGLHYEGEHYLRAGFEALGARKT